jgi:hypothetical protein
MADFVGGLRKRVLFLSVLAIIQIPILWVFVRLWQEPGAVIGYALVQILMIVGYIVIAKRVFFAEQNYFVPGYILQSFGVIALSLVVAVVIELNAGRVGQYSSADLDSFVGLAAYVAAIAVAFVFVKGLRRRFLNLSIFEFTRS